MTEPTPNIRPFMQYLPTARQFPQDWSLLEPQLSKSWYDLASAVNARTIGVYETFQVVTGERWFNVARPSERRQSYRQVYTAPSILLGDTNIPINFNLTTNTSFVHIYGTANWTSNFSVPLPYVNTAVPGDSIQVFINWSATPPIIVLKTTTSNWTSYSAIVVLEYLLN